ncbi:MAG: translation initiation factor IF-2 [Candidatus Azobacteroides sp.]|nr:translation initiation factor IF-2 [Candidatus Azobacteroides sp.]
MAIRLNKVTRDLNVGIATAVDFLRKKGFKVEENPNAKITDEQYDILVKEFNKDMHLKIESERMSQERQNKERNKESVAIEGYESEKHTPKEQPEEIPTKISDDLMPQIKEVGRIDLDAIGKKTVKKEKKEEEKEENLPIVEELPAEEPVEIIVEEKIEELPQENSQEEEPPFVPEKEEYEEADVLEEENTEVQPETSQTADNLEIQEEKKDSENEIFSLQRTEIQSNIRVVDTIDLSALNQRTRPKKKTKEEKRKEREEKDKVRLEQKKQQQQPQQNKPGEQTPENGQTAAKSKRKRIQTKEKVDVSKGGTNTPQSHHNNPHNRGNTNKQRLKKPVRTEVNEEDVQKQIKETLARLTTKGKPNKGSKYRRDKRETASMRQMELAEQEFQESMTLKITEFVTANDLANMMNVSVNQVIATCMSIGMMVSINQRLDAETINIVAEEFGYKTEYVSAEVVEAITEEEDREEDLVSRPPIITVMGHVDHGKTSLLDYVRKANIIAGEAGGITQHIGAYLVNLESGHQITFLDTPGHEAFTAMRARGAQVTDIAIIIVAADDNVMPQTVEAINHASAAGVPIVFAINKIDRPNANPDKIKEALAAMNYLVEEWGGKYQSQDISAKQGIGVNELLEKVILEAELLELKANPNRNAVGSIIESTLDKGRGYVSTVLVQNGTLKMGDVILAGTNFGRVKAMFNERNQRVESASPAEPVLILGLNGAPQAGDTFHVLNTEQEAREIATKREQLQREQGLRTQKLLTLDDIGRRIAIGNFQELNVIVKGDVDGSIEALSDSLIKLSTEEIQVNVIHKAVGQISESDVTLAAASDAIIIGFQVRPSMAARKLAEREGVDIRLYSIIYDAIEEIKVAMEGMLAPTIKEEVVGTAEVREVFKITKVGTVAGCLVRDGRIKRQNRVRLIRDGIVIYTGELGSLKRFKEDVKEVVSGYECGLNINGYNDIKVGDIIEAFEEVEVKKTL